MPTRHFCDICGHELSAQWWTVGDYEMLCWYCYKSVKASTQESEGKKLT